MESRVFYIISFFEILKSIECYRFEPNTFTFEKLTGCPDDENNPVHFSYNTSLLSRNKYEIEAKIHVRETLGAPLEVFLNRFFKSKLNL